MMACSSEKGDGGELAEKEDSKTNLDLVSPEPQIDDASPLVLPDEILSLLLSYLPLKEQFRVQSVNKQWRRCAILRINSLWLYFVDRHEEIGLRLRNPPEDYSVALTFDEVTEFLRKLRKSSFGRVTIELFDFFVRDWKNYCDKPLLQLMAEIAQKAEMVLICFHSLLDLESLCSFCNAVGPWITQLHAHFLTTHDLELTDMFVDSFLKMKKLNAIGGYVPQLILRALVPHSNCKDKPNLAEFNNCISKKSQGALKAFCSEHIRKMEYMPLIEFSSISSYYWYYLQTIHLPNLEQLSFNMGPLLGHNFEDLLNFLNRVSASCIRLSHLYLYYSSKIEHNFTMAELEGLFGAIGQLSSLRVLHIELRLHFLEDVHSVEPLHILQNGAGIKDFCGHLEIWPNRPELNSFDKMHVWGSLNEVLLNVEKLHIFSCHVDELPHLINLPKLKCLEVNHLMASESLPLDEGHIIDIVTSCSSIISLKMQHVSQTKQNSSTGPQLPEKDPAFFPTTVLCESLIEVSKIRLEHHRDLEVILSGSQREEDLWRTYQDVVPHNLKLMFDGRWQLKIGKCECKFWPCLC